MKWGSKGLFGTVHWDASWLAADTRGHPFFSTSRCDVSRCPREAHLRPRGKGPSGRGVFDSSYCSCLHHLAYQSHPGRRGQSGSALNVMRPEHPSSLSVPLSVFGKAQTSYFSHITKGLCQHRACRPRVRLHSCNAADKPRYHSFSLYPSTQFHSTDQNMFFFFYDSLFIFALRGCCIRIESTRSSPEASRGYL